MAGNWYGNYRGEVEQVEDRAGRIKVRVWDVYGDITTSRIPWAIYADSFMGGGPSRGGRFIPDIGDHVWVFFEQGDPEQPVYWAGAPARDDGPAEATPTNRVIRTKAGHLIELDDTEDETRIRIEHGSGSFEETTHDGSTLKQVVGNLTIMVDGDAFVDVSGDLLADVGGDLDIDTTGNVRVASAMEITLDVSNTSITGDVNITGDATIGGISFLGHTHGGVESGGSNTGTPQ